MSRFNCFLCFLHIHHWQLAQISFAPSGIKCSPYFWELQPEISTGPSTASSLTCTAQLGCLIICWVPDGRALCNTARSFFVGIADPKGMVSLCLWKLPDLFSFLRKEKIWEGKKNCRHFENRSGESLNSSRHCSHLAHNKLPDQGALHSPDVSADTAFSNYPCPQLTYKIISSNNRLSISVTWAVLWVFSRHQPCVCNTGLFASSTDLYSSPNACLLQDVRMMGHADICVNLTVFPVWVLP